MRARLRPSLLFPFVAFTLLVACSVRSRRDPEVPGKEVTFDDSCGLQPYFDERRTANLGAPKAADEMLATNGKGEVLGEGHYVLEDHLARTRFARLLREEFIGVSPQIVEAVASHSGQIVLKVRWWDAGKIKRIRPDDGAVLQTPKGEVELPSNMCLSDFLFGAEVYAMRARYLKNEVNLATGKPLVGPPEPSASASVSPSVTPVPPPAPAPSTSAAP